MKLDRIWPDFGEVIEPFEVVDGVVRGDQETALAQQVVFLSVE
jgi:hypothetical protein